MSKDKNGFTELMMCQNQYYLYITNLEDHFTEGAMQGGALSDGTPLYVVNLHGPFY